MPREHQEGRRHLDRDLGLYAGCERNIWALLVLFASRNLDRSFAKLLDVCREWVSCQRVPMR